MSRMGFTVMSDSCLTHMICLTHMTHGHVTPLTKEIRLKIFDPIIYIPKPANLWDSK